jgi:hypothetical protein
MESPDSHSSFRELLVLNSNAGHLDQVLVIGVEGWVILALYLKGICN